MTTVSNVDRSSAEFVRNAQHYATLLATLHERTAQAMRSCSVASSVA